VWLYFRCGGQHRFSQLSARVINHRLNFGGDINEVLG